MSNLCWLTDAQMARLERFFTKSHGKPRVDDRRVLSGINFINRNLLRWRDAPTVYDPHKMLYNRWKRWRDKGVFARMMAGLATEHGETMTVMIDATYLKAYQNGDQFGREKGERGRLIDRTKGGMNTKLDAICDSHGRPPNLFVTDGQVSDYIAARALLSSFLDVDWLLGHRGYDADWFREALKDNGIRACIPARKQRKKALKYGKSRYKRLNRNHVRQAEGLATRCDTMRQVFKGLPVSNRTCCHRHLLALKLNEC